MHDPTKRKTYYGTSFGTDDVENTLKKALEEVAMEFYFSTVAGDERIGEESSEFSHSSFSELYSSITTDKIAPSLLALLISQKESNVSFNSDFTFRVFPVQNSLSNIRLFVSQAFTE